jgi:hypothetical protein
MIRLDQLPWLLWRLARNSICAFPLTQKILFPSSKLAAQFGPGDGAYGWQVFCAHSERLRMAGFSGADSILEVGPGRNIGTSLLWYSIAMDGRHPRTRVALWDVISNVDVDADAWSDCADNLLRSQPRHVVHPSGATEILRRIAAGTLVPDISYHVCQYHQLVERYQGQPFGLIYSHASLEHAWAICETWNALAVLTADSGWHSHRIDLADHGRRDANYIEMCEWPEWAYKLTMNRIPGAINRYRANDHLRVLEDLGFEIITEGREIRPDLPVARERLAEPFKHMDTIELRTTAIDIVAKRRPV